MTIMKCLKVESDIIFQKNLYNSEFCEKRIVSKSKGINRKRVGAFFLTLFSQHPSNPTAPSHIIENLTGFSQPVNLFPHHSHRYKDILQVEKKRRRIK